MTFPFIYGIINNEDPNAMHAVTLGSPTIAHESLFNTAFGGIVQENRIWVKEDKGSCFFFAEPAPEKTPDLNRVWIWAFENYAQRGSKA